MKKGIVFYSEMAYIAGIALLAFGTALMAKADFGMSMVVAPAYLLHLKISPAVSWFTFGAAEYILQAVLIIALSCLLKRFKKHYLFSFVTAVIYGVVLDLCMKAVSFLTPGFPVRVVLFVSGMLLCTLGIAFLFHTYIAPEAYELVVKEISDTYHLDSGRVKTVYDVTSCLISVVLSFVFFSRLEGIKAGTFVCTLFNGWLIGRFDHLLSSFLTFKDAFALRRYFEE